MRLMVERPRQGRRARLVGLRPTTSRGDDSMLTNLLSDAVAHLAAVVGGLTQLGSTRAVLRRERGWKVLVLGTLCGHPSTLRWRFVKTSLWSGHPEEKGAFRARKKVPLVQADMNRMQYRMNPIYPPSVNSAMIREIVEVSEHGGPQVCFWGWQLHPRVPAFLRHSPFAGYHDALDRDRSRPNGQPRRLLTTTRPVGLPEQGIVLADQVRWSSGQSVTRPGTPYSSVPDVENVRSIDRVSVSGMDASVGTAP
jgi:hypothetical protein